MTSYDTVNDECFERKIIYLKNIETHEIEYSLQDRGALRSVDLLNNGFVNYITRKTVERCFFDTDDFLGLCQCQHQNYC